MVDAEISAGSVVVTVSCARADFAGPTPQEQSVISFPHPHYFGTSAGKYKNSPGKCVSVIVTIGCVFTALN